MPVGMGCGPLTAVTPGGSASADAPGATTTAGEPPAAGGADGAPAPLPRSIAHRRPAHLLLN
eukprot:1837080-Alexandrium_andersonii.AAC.1